MQPLSRRGVALLATTAVLGAGSLTTVAQASAAATVGNSVVRTDRTILDDLAIAAALTALNLPLPVVQTIVSNLGLGLLDELLAAANPTQLTTLLSGLTGPQI